MSLRRPRIGVRGRLRPLAVAACALALAACGAPDADADPEPVATDSTLAAALADLHLADARAETTGEPRDSLRAAALDLHGLDSTTLADRVERATRRPDEAAALTRAVSERLSSTLP